MRHTRVGSGNVDRMTLRIDGRAATRPCEASSDRAGGVTTRRSARARLERPGGGVGRARALPYPYPRHVPVLARKPGVLRNGAPFKDWLLPGAIGKVRAKLAGSDDGATAALRGAVLDTARLRARADGQDPHHGYPGDAGGAATRRHAFGLRAQMIAALRRDHAVARVSLSTMPIMTSPGNSISPGWRRSQTNSPIRKPRSRAIALGMQRAHLSNPAPAATSAPSHTRTPCRLLPKRQCGLRSRGHPSPVSIVRGGTTGNGAT